MTLTATQKIKWAILRLSSEVGDSPKAVLEGLTPEQLCEHIDSLYQTHLVDQDLHIDLENEFRQGEQETDIPPDHPYNRGLSYYEKKSVAAQMPDGSWVGWIYWYGGGKHSEPEAIDWMGDAYEVTVEEKPVQIIQRTFSRQAGFTVTELMIVITILFCLAALGYSGAIQSAGSPGAITFGLNGMTEERCIGGYKHVVGERGQARQILDGKGHGIPCN